MNYSSHFADIDGVQTHYLTAGKSNNLLVFLHGWGGSVDSFRELAASIHEQNNFAVLLLDFPNFGSSGATPKAWDSADYAKFLKKFLTQVAHNKKLYFYAHSFGGKTLCQLLFKDPKFATKIVLSGASGIVLPFTPRQRIARLMAKIFKYPARLLPSKFRKRLGAKLSGSRAHLEATESQKSSLQKVLKEKDFRDKLPKITIETLLLWGEGDTYTPLQAGRIFAQKLPNATLHTFPDGRHGTHYTHKTQITRLVTQFFLDK